MQKREETQKKRVNGQRNGRKTNSDRSFESCLSLAQMDSAKQRGLFSFRVRFYARRSIENSLRGFGFAFLDLVFVVIALVVLC